MSFFCSTFAADLKKVRHIVLLLLLLLASWAGATTVLTSNDKNWIGGMSSFTTTEGNDYWLTFMNNDMVNPEDYTTNPDFKFEMKLALSARETMKVEVYIGTTRLTTLTIQGGETYVYTIDKSKAKDIYLLESEKTGYKGVHVFAAEGYKNKFFSCFLYNRVGESGGSSRDAALIIPTRFLGKEYIIQTSPEDEMSSEFAIVATQAGTEVKITPTFDTYGKKPAGTEFTVKLGAGQAYLVASKQHVGNDDFNVDLSGSTICSNKPIAVFNGNQQTSLPVDEASSRDFATEQALPVAKWGKEFYVSLLDSTRANHLIITAGHLGATVTIKPYNAAGTAIGEEEHALAAGESYDPIKISDNIAEMMITSDRPIMCYDYLSSAGDNTFTIGTGTAAWDIKTGDPANAMLPAWEHRVKSMNFFTHELDPQKLLGKTPPQIFKAYVITKTADKGKLSLDGRAVDGSLFKAFKGNSAMSYACLSLGTSTYHTLESTGDGFVGMVYALSHAQGYFYTLGFTPPQPEDSLYVLTDGVMSDGSYDLPRTEYGWYQRQADEWTKPRLDTAVVCDTTLIQWQIIIPQDKPFNSLDWAIYDVTGKKKPSSSNRIDNASVGASGSQTVFPWEHEFILPDEEEDGRKPYHDYEIQAIFHRDQLFCGGEDLDTLRTMVRVTRMYNDTVYRIICMGDSIDYFRDERFIADKQGTPSTDKRHYVNVGEHTFHREYSSAYRCDSLMTLVLFVCDTFRFQETYHLCSNQDTLIHEELFRGRDYKGNRKVPGAKINKVTKDTTVFVLRKKTKFCGCQLNDKFPPFEGCDSIYDITIIQHPSWIKEKTDTLCLNSNTDSLYRWPINYGRDVKIIGKDSAGMEWHEKEHAWFGTFSDTLKTTTCPECHDGGCDSINMLHLVIPKAYYFEEEDEWCTLRYDALTHDTTRVYYTWTGHKDANGKDRILYTTGDYYDACTTRYGCDSIYHIRLEYKAADPLYALTVDTLCYDENGVFPWTNEKGELIEEVSLDVSIPKNARCTTLYRHDDSRCDTVYALHLTIMPKYYFPETVLMTQEDVYYWPVSGKTYGGEKTTQRHDSTIYEDVIITYHYMTNPLGTHRCDSIHVLDLRVGNVYRDTTQGPDIYACGQEKEYVWMGVDHQGNDSVRKVIPEEELPEFGMYKWYRDTFKTYQDFDSVYYLYLYRAPSYKDTTHVSECQSRITGARYIWEGHENRTIYDRWGDLMPFIPLMFDGDAYYLDTMHTADYGCDSLCVLHLHVNPYYDKDAKYTICQDEPFVWEDLPGNTQPDSILTDTGVKLAGAIPTEHIGDFEYTLWFQSAYGCDSLWHLSLHIDTVYKDPVEITERVMCDNDTIHFLGETIYGAKSPLLPAGTTGLEVQEDERWHVYEQSGITPSSTQCDSAVMHRITVYKTYLFTEPATICQTPEHLDEPYYEWTGHGEVWDVENGHSIPANLIPTKVEGNKTYTYIDSLHTTACEACRDGLGGCDSIHILQLRIDSSYHIRQSFSLCDYDSMTWQGIHYAGEKLENPWPGYRILKSDTTYRDTVPYGTRFTACDSTYYLTLRVAPSYDTTLVRHVCDNDSSTFAHVYEFSDIWGHYHRDSLIFNPEPTYPNIRKQDKTMYAQYLLKTVEDCDSLVTYEVIIHPTYHIVDAGKGCAGYAIEWRGEIIDGTGTYFVNETTKSGCDSIFELDFYVKPFKTVEIHDMVCENEYYYHRDTVGLTIFAEEVWHPGAPRPDPETEPINVHFTGSDGCDSIVYRYYMTVCPVYIFNETTDNLCSGDIFYSEDLNHSWDKWRIEYDVDRYVAPYDTTFRDTLSTVRGCDSIYNLRAHVLPAYRHIEYDTICSNDQIQWRDTILTNMPPGLNIVHDSFPTIHGCDSIYELQLYVQPHFFSEDTVPLCADDSIEWHDWHIAHLTPREELYFYYDSTTTQEGCDSIYHLYVRALDTTMVVVYDTICTGDTLFVVNHQYTRAGFYKDTTLNADGCHEFIYTFLEVIPPTVPTIWATNPMCQSETAFELYYTYTSHVPIRYSLYFDSVGLSMGFEDQIDVPIREYTDPMVISVPIPYRDDDPTHYPRPDNYSVRLVLDNGLCRHKEWDCYDDSSFVMSYPKWITEQRYGDVIALLNESYNGGYSWSDYQWYKGDELLPGETKEFLYLPMGLEIGAQYHVLLTRQGETKAFPSCPITIVRNPIGDDTAPTMGYLSVTPTCLAVSHPVMHILSRKDGTYRVTNIEGHLIKEGVFRADVTEVEIPPTEGMYIVQLWSHDTPEEPYRAIKVIVSKRCENCDISSF